MCAASIAQHAPLTVAEAKENAVRLGASKVSVRGHLWIGKEGSMIYDKGYRATLRLRFSEAFNAKHSFHELIGKVRQSDLATITGNLSLGADGKSSLVADDIEFVDKP